MAVSNGIQTEAIFETYKLLYHTASRPTGTYLKKIMDGAGTEPDSLNTPRIGGIITAAGEGKTVFIISIVTHERPAAAWRVRPGPGMFYGVATYSGDMASPGAFKIEGGPVTVACRADTPGALAEYFYGISAATYRGEDIRVCTIGGVRSGDGHTWEMAAINRHDN